MWLNYLSLLRFKIANGKVGVSLAGNLKGNLWTDFHDF